MVVLDFIGSLFASEDTLYTLSSRKTTASEAQRLCSSINGKLAEFTSKQVQENIRPLLVEEYVGQGTSFNNYLLMLNDLMFRS